MSVHAFRNGSGVACSELGAQVGVQCSCQNESAKQLPHREVGGNSVYTAIGAVTAPSCGGNMCDVLLPVARKPGNCCGAVGQMYGGACDYNMIDVDVVSRDGSGSDRSVVEHLVGQSAVSPPAVDEIHSAQCTTSCVSSSLHDTGGAGKDFHHEEFNQVPRDTGNILSASADRFAVFPCTQAGNMENGADMGGCAQASGQYCWLELGPCRNGLSRFMQSGECWKQRTAVDNYGDCYMDGVPDCLEPLLLGESLHKASLKGSGNYAEGFALPTIGKKARKSHFSETVIRSVSFVECNEGIQVVVEPEYPRLALAGLIIAVTFFVLHWCVDVVVAGTTAGAERVAALTTIEFIASGVASVIMLLCLIVMWRPGREEMNVLKSYRGFLRSTCVIASGAVATLSLICSFTLVNGSVGLACLCCCPLVGTYIYEVLKFHSVSLLITMAAVLVSWAFTALAIGCYIGSDDRTLSCLWPVAIVTVGGGALSVYVFQFRNVGREVNGMFLIFCTLVVVTLLLALLSYITGGFSTPPGPAEHPSSMVVVEDIGAVLFSSFLLVLYHLMYHIASPFSNRLSLPGSIAFGGPISLLSFHFALGPVVPWPLEVVGGILMTAGGSLILMDGYHQWQRVETFTGTD